MKRIPVNLKLTNYDDALSAAAGVVSPAAVGAVDLAGFADTQRYGLFLPQCVITRLGLHPARNAYHPEATAHSAIFEVKGLAVGT